MYAEERQQAMAQMVMARGRVSVNELADEFSVTTETVRRDLSALERMRVVRRVHGGAVPTATLSVMESGLDERDISQAREKERIALAARDLVPHDGGTAIFDAGSTTARLADFLPTEARFTAFTHAVPIASRLGAVPGVDLHLLPGRVRATTQAAVGAVTVQALAPLRVDVAFVGTNAVSLEIGCSTPDPEEAAVKRALVKAARQVVVVTDSTKFGRDATMTFAKLEEVDVIVTDDGVDPDAARALSEAGVEVIIA